MREANEIFDKVFEKPYNSLVISPFRNSINSIVVYLNEMAADPNIGKYKIGNWFDFKVQENLAGNEEGSGNENENGNNNNGLLSHTDGF